MVVAILHSISIINVFNNQLCMLSGNAKEINTLLTRPAAKGLPLTRFTVRRSSSISALRPLWTPCLSGAFTSPESQQSTNHDDDNSNSKINI